MLKEEKAVTAIIITTNPKFFLTVAFLPGLFLAWLNDSPGSNLTLTWNRTLGLICESREADNTSPCVLCCCSRSRYIYNWLTHSAAAFSIFLQFPNVWIYLMALMPHFLVGFVRNCSRCDSRRVIKICVPSSCNFFSNGKDRALKRTGFFYKYDRWGKPPG